MSSEEGARTPVSAGLADDLARLHRIPLDVGVPGELFLGAAPAAVAGPPPGSWRDAGLAAAGERDPGALPGLAARIRAGSLSVAGVVEAACDRIRTSDDVQAWVHTDPGAVEAARGLDDELARGAWRGPLHGIPIGVKDIVDVAGLPTAAGSRQWSGPGRERVPVADAGSVALLRAAGAVVVGKTTTHEFAFGGTTPPTRNPHDRRRVPGGSSGGSAAAVAAGHVRLAVGTDTAGSVRIPSSYCGTVGLVPSVGLLPRDGVAPLAWSLDRVGLITAEVADLAWAAAALGLVGTPPRAPGDAVGELDGLRVGIPVDALADPLDPAVAAAFESVVARLRAAGAVVTTVGIEHSWAAVTAGVAIFLAESRDHHRDRWAQTPELFGADVRATLELADRVSGADYVRAQRVRAALRAEALAALTEVDLLLTPTMPSGAPAVEQAAGGVVVIDGREVSLAEAHLRFNVLANLAALPAGTQPMGVDRDRLPLGVQWVGPPGGDDRLVAAMTALEALLRSRDGSGVPPAQKSEVVRG